MKTIQEMTPEQKAYHDKCLAEYRLGGYKHESFVLNHTFGMGSKNLGLVTPAIVGMGQDGDPYYTQYFQNWTEVNEFIQELKNSSTEAWGEQA